MKKHIITSIIATAMAVGSLIGFADAHTPSVMPTCSGLVVNLVNYEGGSTNNSIGINIAHGGGGSNFMHTTFGGSYSNTFAWSQTVSQTWTVTIDANINSGDPTKYDKTFSGVQQPCQVAPTTTTTVTPTTTTTTVAPTTTTIAEGAPTTQATTTTVIAASPCQEDDPCWDCATMGNFICGPDALPVVPVVPNGQLGSPLVVTADPVALPRTGAASHAVLELGAILSLAGIVMLTVIARRRPA